VEHLPARQAKWSPLVDMTFFTNNYCQILDKSLCGHYRRIRDKELKGAKSGFYSPIEQA
jgi:hypothetical protein